MRQYQLISGDSHVNEPPDLWQTRMPAKYKDRAPRMVRFEKGDAWVIEGTLDPITFGRNLCATGPAIAWVKWENLTRTGGWNPKARCAEMDVDGVDGEILFPTPRISSALYWNRTDPEFHIAQIRAYNDWLSEYGSYAPDRLFGLAMIPNVGLEPALAEFRRVMKLPGIRGIVLGQYPNGSGRITREDDAFWAEAVSVNMPITVHVRMVQEPAGEHQRQTGAMAAGVFGSWVRYRDAALGAAEFIYSQVFDRFPDLQLAIAEVDCGWIPYVKEQMDNVYNRGLTEPPDLKLRLLPSSYYDRNISFTYMTDTHGVKTRHAVGIDRMLWSSDYPHSSSDWPHSWQQIEKAFEGVPADEKHKILAGNLMRLYHIG